MTFPTTLKNIYSELPRHVDRSVKLTLENIIQKSFNDKEAKNSSDCRESLLIVTNWFIQNNNNKSNKSNEFSSKILETLTEIQGILYLPDNQRNTTRILRLINITFVHAMFIKMLFKGNIKSLTSRKFFWKVLSLPY